MGGPTGPTKKGFSFRRKGPQRSCLWKYAEIWAARGGPWGGFLNSALKDGRARKPLKTSKSSHEGPYVCCIVYNVACVAPSLTVVLVPAICIFRLHRSLISLLLLCMYVKNFERLHIMLLCWRHSRSVSRLVGCRSMVRCFERLQACFTGPMQSEFGAHFLLDEKQNHAGIL